MASNGKLDVNTLTQVPLSAGGFGYLENGTAQGWFAARADIIRTTGVVPIIINDGLYRDYARQVYWKTYWTRLGKPQNAATPGTSNHGLGLAVDVNNISAYNQSVLDAAMSRHGFVRDTNETWHYHHTSTNPADSGSTPIESENMPLDANDKVFMNQVADSIIQHITGSNPAYDTPEKLSIKQLRADLGYLAGPGGSPDSLAVIHSAVGKPSTIDLDTLAAKIAPLVKTAEIDYQALAKAVNDDAAKRMES